MQSGIPTMTLIQESVKRLFPTAIATLAGAVFGFMLCSIVLYPSSADWANKIDWGDAAAWFSGFGAMAAVVVALWLAKASEQQRRVDQDKLAKIFSGMAIEDTYAVVAHLQHFLLTLRDGECIGSIDYTLYALSKSKCPALDACMENLSAFDIDTAVQIGRSRAKLLAVAALAAENAKLVNSSWKVSPPKDVIENVDETVGQAVDLLYGTFERLVLVSGSKKPYDPRKHGEETYKQKKERQGFILVPAGTQVAAGTVVRPVSRSEMPPNVG